MFLLLLLALVGALVLVIIAVDSLWSVLELISSYLMPYFLPSEVQPLVKKFGPWAAVTGATDGIGKQYALELAKRGLHLVIISRNPEKLKAVAAEIEKHNVKTKIIVADFSKGAEIYPNIEQELKHIPLGLLVNNVGVNYDQLTPLCEIPQSKIWELINVNVGAVTNLTRMVLPGMVERGRGGIVNISSGSELQPLPLMAIYAATKNYIRSFTLAIREEYASKGIYVQLVSPLFVNTKINAYSDKLLETSFLVPDAATYARHAVWTLGRVHNTTGYWLHGIQSFVIKLSPEWIRTKVGMRMNTEFNKHYNPSSKLKLQ